MKVYFSNQGNLRNFRTFLGAVDFSDPEHLEIETHPTKITVHPAHLTFAAALALKVEKQNAVISNNTTNSARYLDRMGLYNFLSTPSPFSYEKIEEAGRFIPLKVIKNQSDQSKFVADFVPLLHLPEKNARVVRYVVGELLRNVLEHSYSKDGAVVAAQYYNRSNKVSLAICDTGIGIWKSISRSWTPRNDVEAINLALSPGISGTTRKEGGTFENAGAGLFYVRSIAKVSRNYFLIYSGRAEYMLTKRDKRSSLKLIANPDKEKHISISDAPDFSGTLVAVDISLDETPEFDELLREISSVYDKAIRERRRNKFYTPIFERSGE